MVGLPIDHSVDIHRTFTIRIWQRLWASQEASLNGLAFRASLCGTATALGSAALSTEGEEGCLVTHSRDKGTKDHPFSFYLLICPVCFLFMHLLCPMATHLRLIVTLGLSSTLADKDGPQAHSHTT